MLSVVMMITIHFCYGCWQKNLYIGVMCRVRNFLFVEITVFESTAEAKALILTSQN